MTPAQMTQLTNRVVARFEVELAEADQLQLDHLAQRAEARYSSGLGARMRACVDFEKARRTVTAGIGGAR
jgi:hypothetical protein